MTAIMQSKDNPRAASMMELLMMLLEDFSALGKTSEAGPHIHELMGLVHGDGAVAASRRGSLPPKPARRSAARRASETLGS
jgi:hypothetical protein